MTLGEHRPTTPPSVKTGSPIAILAGNSRIAIPNPPARPYLSKLPTLNIHHAPAVRPYAQLSIIYNSVHDGLEAESRYGFYAQLGYDVFAV